jgi:hypothetical protein
MIVIPQELRRVPLSLDTLLSLMRWQGADPHPVLANTPVWRDPDTAAAEDRRVIDELRGLGLHDGRRLTPDFADVVGALVRPRRELYGWLTTVEDGVVCRRGLLAVSAYQIGVVLVRLDTDHTVMASVPPSRVAAAFAGELPDVPAAPGREITTAYRTYLAALDDGDGFDGFGADNDPDAHEMRDLLTRPRLGSGELYAAVRDGTGTRRRIERPVVYLDTAQGRRIVERRSGGTDDTAALLPADAAAVTERLVRWLDATAPG